MRTDMAEHSALSITAGGAVTALGAALLTVGLAQPGAADPFQNWWTRAGLAVIALGTGWVLWSFVVALQASRKNRAVRERLGEALDVGEGLRRSRLGGHIPEKTRCRSWPIERAT